MTTKEKICILRFLAIGGLLITIPIATVLNTSLLASFIIGMLVFLSMVLLLFAAFYVLYRDKNVEELNKSSIFRDR